MPLLKLKDPTGMLYDPRSGFLIVRDQKVPKPAKLPRQVKQWLDYKALIEIPDPPPEAPAAADGKAVAIAEETTSTEKKPGLLGRAAPQRKS